MVINTNNNGVGNTPANLRSKASSSPAEPQTNTPKPDAPAAARDNVSLSQEAKTLTRLEASINATPDVDSDRVAAIKQAIADGSFSIDAESIANRMLEQEDLLS